MYRQKILPLYMRIFLSVSLVVVITQSFLTIYLTGNLHSRYLEDIIEKAEISAASISNEICDSYHQLEATAYSLIYSNINQDLMAISRHASETERMKYNDALNSLLSVIAHENTSCVDYILMPTQSPGSVYSTVKRLYSGLYTESILNYSRSDWFLDFEASPDVTSRFYANVSYPTYSRFALPPLHVRMFRINPLHDTAKTIGYLAMVINRDYFSNLFSPLNGIASDILLLGENGECLYEALSTMNRTTLRDHAQIDPHKVYKSDSGSYYTALQIPIEELGWTMYCSVDVTQAYASIQHTYTTWILVSFALLLALLAVIYHLCHRLTLPLKHVVDGMTRVSAGDYGVHLSEIGNDEVAALTVAFNSMTRQLDDAHRNLRKYQMIQQSTAFYALQQQVSPHMLFNTLDMIIGMATQKDYASIISACSCLASMFRYNLSRDLTVPLGEELNHIRNYIEILTMRNNGRIRGEIHCPASETGTLIPKLALQPFVENSIKYAFEQKYDDCLITVCVERSRDFLTATIRDNGSGFPPKVLEELQKTISAPYQADVPGRHIGILNVCKRMHLIYGDSFTIELNNAEEGGAAIRLCFPPDFPKNVI